MRRPYPPEFRQRAVALVRAGKQIKQVAYELSISAGCLHNWVRQGRIDRDNGMGLVPFGAEFVIRVGDRRFQAQSDVSADKIRCAARVTVRGRFAVVGAYEWEAFGLEDTRSDWLVRSAVPADDGDALLDLSVPPLA